MRKLLSNKSKNVFKVHIKHYWHSLGVSTKNTTYFSGHQTILLHTFQEFASSNTDTFREVLPNNIDLEIMSNSIHTFTEVLPNKSQHFFESLDEHYNRQEIPITKRKLGPVIQNVPRKIEIFPSPSGKIRKIFLAPTKKMFVGKVKVVYNTMEHKDTNTDFHVVRVGDQK